MDALYCQPYLDWHSGLKETYCTSGILSFLVYKMGLLIAPVSYVRYHVSARYWWWWSIGNVCEDVYRVVAPHILVTVLCTFLGGAQHSPKARTGTYMTVSSALHKAWHRAGTQGGPPTAQCLTSVLAHRR